MSRLERPGSVARGAFAKEPTSGRRDLCRQTISGFKFEEQHQVVLRHDLTLQLSFRSGDMWTGHNLGTAIGVQMLLMNGITSGMRFDGDRVERT